MNRRKQPQSWEEVHELATRIERHRKTGGVNHEEMTMYKMQRRLENTGLCIPNKNENGEDVARFKTQNVLKSTASSSGSRQSFARRTPEQSYPESSSTNSTYRYQGQGSDYWTSGKKGTEKERS